MKPNKKWIPTALIAALPFSLATARAESTVGNGGVARVCFKDSAIAANVERVLLANKRIAKPGETPSETQTQIKKEDPFTQEVLENISSIELYDIYVASRTDDVTLMDPSGMSMNEIIESRLKLFDLVSFGIELRNAKKKMKLWIGADSGVAELDDSVPRILFPKECLPIQIGYQDHINGEDIVYYEKRLLAKMDPLNRAAFRLHEYLYNLIWKTSTDARPVQSLTGQLFTSTFEKFSPSEINELLISLGFTKDAGVIEKFLVKDQTLLVTDIKRIGKKIVSARLVENTQIALKGTTYHLEKGLLQFDENENLLSANIAPSRHKSGALLTGESRFHSNGELASALLENETTLTVGKNVYSFTGSLKFHDDGSIKAGKLGSPFSFPNEKFSISEQVSFYKNGQIASANFKTNTANADRVDSIGYLGGVPCKIDNEAISFYEDGTPKECVLGTFHDWKTIRFVPGTKISFYSDGAVETGIPLNEVSLKDGRLICVAKEIIHFYPDGSPVKCRTNHIYVDENGISFLDRFRYYDSLEFYPNGRTKGGILYQSHTIQGISFKHGVWFYESGKINGGFLDGDHRIGGTDYRDGWYLFFDESGNVLDFKSNEKN